jgi:hypothetical protein
MTMEMIAKMIGMEYTVKYTSVPVVISAHIVQMEIQLLTVRSVLMVHGGIRRRLPLIVSV